eukprot:TRINITY_DN22713_c1_g1_i1.p1 TRINITY_DN22713_c1_g1~~TRINITY_DN22713_c1_g1_i1.p1  ORF type:complete len:388 (-),score=59.70 TRINITY_DN22713_c1_g1_i1:697-1860(-)
MQAFIFCWAMTNEEVFVCMRCGKEASMSCPKCVEMNLPKLFGAFCSQECFQQSWQKHKKLHKVSSDSWMYVSNRGKGRENLPPKFQWTGDLRPDRVGPRQVVPQNIPLPDYALTGIPHSEVQSRQQNIISTRSQQEIEGIRAACALGRQVLDKAHAAIKPGITTDEIDKVVHEATIQAGAYPSPLNYFSFPKSVCTSVNEVICHGIPDNRKLVDGDIVNVDVTCFLNGFHGDLNETFVVGDNVDGKSKELIKTTHDALMAAIETVKPGTRFRDVGDIINTHCVKNGFSVVRTYCGHGIGDLFHCAPSIPHYANNKTKGVMKEGMTFTIEPMVNMGSWKDTTWPDGWTAVTQDGQRSAQFEHTLLVTAQGCDILTARTPNSPPLCWQS